MENRLNKIFSITSIVLLSLVGCSNSKHNHDGIYHNDENGHWNGCVVDGCDEKFNEEFHLWGEAEIIKEATCTTHGLEKYECSVCHRVEKRNINKISHTYPVEYQKDDNYHWNVCSICNTTKESSKVDHFYSNWETLEEATTSSDGLKEGTCVCGHKKREIIPMIVINTQTIMINTPKEIVNGGISLATGSFDLSYTITPNDATDYDNDDIVISSSNENVAIIDKEKVVLLKEGYTEISVTNGVKTAKLPLVVTAKNIDGNIEAEYPSYEMNTVVTNEAGYNTTIKTNVFFGDGGLYFIHQVSDKYIGGLSHVEASLCFGDECNKNNTLFMNFYPIEDSFGHAKFYGNVEDYSKYSELTGKNSFPCAVEGKVLGEKGNYEGYVIEAFIPYDKLRGYGYQDNLTSVKYLPLVYQYKNQKDADTAGLLGNDEGIESFASYGNINTISSKYENHLMTIFNKNGSFICKDKAPLVRYTFDNGVISNTGISSANGRVTTIDGNNTAIQELDNPTITYGLDSKGNDNSAILLSNKRAGGNHFTINGINVGTGDFTISVKINIQQLTTKTDRSNYLFGIGNKKDPDYGYFNVSYMKNKSMNLNQIAVGVHNTTDKTTNWCGYIPVGEFAEIRLVRKGNMFTSYLKYDANTNGIRKKEIELSGKDAINYTSNCNLGFSSNIGAQNPGEFPAYYDDILIYDYALPI